MENILRDITQSFNTLWHFKKLGNTYEIITPFSSTNNNFISVFLTMRNGGYVITDGGWISNNFYDVEFDASDETLAKIFNYYAGYYSIKTTEASGVVYYFKSTNNINMISSLIYDVSNFISTIVSSTLISFQDEKDKDSARLFRSEANGFINSIFSKDALKFKGVVDPNLGSVRFNAVVTQNDKFSLINYVTGTNEYYFINSIGKSNMTFQIINKSSYAQFIKNRITLVDDSASGYKREKVDQYLSLIPDVAQAKIIGWNEKERIRELV